METAFPQYQWETSHPPQVSWTETPCHPHRSRNSMRTRTSQGPPPIPPRGRTRNLSRLIYINTTPGTPVSPRKEKCRPIPRGTTSTGGHAPAPIPASCLPMTEQDFPPLRPPRGFSQAKGLDVGSRPKDPKRFSGI